MIGYIDLIGTILSFIGIILIVKKQWYGYVVWCFSNICWVIIGINAQAWGQVFTFGVLYILANIWGMWEWKFKPKKLTYHRYVDFKINKTIGIERDKDFWKERVPEILAKFKKLSGRMNYD